MKGILWQFHFPRKPVPHTMKTTLISAATCFLLLAGCQKTDIQPGDSLSSTGNDHIAVACTPDVISFNNASGLLTNVTSDGGTVIGMTSANPHYTGQDVAAIVFNTNPLSSAEDDDLGTPNTVAVPGGTGVGAGGASGPYINNTNLGKILVLHNFNYPISEPNDDDFNYTEPSGTITFNFSSVGTVTATSITVIDVEAVEAEVGSVTLYSAPGGTNLGKFSFPDTGANGVAVVSLGNTPGVGYMVVSIGGSMGIDNIRFCKSTPPSTQCTRTQGYWKNHAEAWPVSSLTLGTVTYTKTQLLQILNTPVRGNGLISLAYQLIAAKLNIAKGTAPTTISSTITAADNLIGSKNILNGGTLSPSQTSALTDKLDSYNNGLLGPKHCD